MSKEEVIKNLKNGLIVSCQMEKHAPCYSDDIVELMVKAAEWGGACCIRLNGIENIHKIRPITKLPIIGLVKVFREDTDIFMTPNMELVDQLVREGVEIVAVDGTDRIIDGKRGYDIIPEIRKKYPDVLIFADCRDEIDADASLSLGADFVAPTFYRFKKDAKSTDLPDWQMFNKMVEVSKGRGYPIMEGKIWTPDDAIKALYYGAYAVCVGSAITRPHLITQRFCDHMNGFKKDRSLIY